MKRFWLIITIISVMAAHVFAREKPPIPFNAFDGGRVGGKAQGMGFAYTAVADTADAPYWNAAGMCKMTGNLFTVSLDAVRQSRIPTNDLISGESLRGRILTFLSFTGQNGAIGYRPLANISQNIIISSTTGVTNYEERQIKINSFFLAATSKYNDAMSMGISIGYLNGRLALARNVAGRAEPATAILDDGNGVTLDWSMLYHPNKVVNFGINVQNLPGYVWWGSYEKSTLPTFLRAGIAVQLNNLMTLSYDYEKRFYRDNADKPRYNHIGLEQQLGALIKIRGGIYGEDFNDPQKSHYTAGAGFVNNNYFVDIAMDKYNKLNEKAEVEPVYDYLVSITLPFGALTSSNRRH